MHPNTEKTNKNNQSSVQKHPNSVQRAVVEGLRTNRLILIQVMEHIDSKDCQSCH